MSMRRERHARTDADVKAAAVDHRQPLPPPVKPAPRADAVIIALGDAPGGVTIQITPAAVCAQVIVRD